MSLKIPNFNARSLLNKLDDFHSHVGVERPSLVVISETWLHRGVLSSEISPPGYFVVSRKDRLVTHNGRGGGVLVLCRNDLKATRINSSHRQTCGIRIGNKNVFCTYLSPNSSSAEDDELNLFLTYVGSNALILGDFNHPSIDWPHMQSRSKRDSDF